MIFIPSTCSWITSRTTSRVSSRIWHGTIFHVRHLRADSVVWLSHTSSIWPWSGAPKVHLYDTFLGGLCQSQNKDCFLFNAWWINMKRAMPPFKQGIHQCSKNDTYTFHPNKELVMYMLFEFIDGLKVGTWNLSTIDGWQSCWSIWTKHNQAPSNRSDL